MTTTTTTFKAEEELKAIRVLLNISESVRVIDAVSALLCSHNEMVRDNIDLNEEIGKLELHHYELNKTKETNDKLVGLLSNVIERTPCSQIDHNGICQTHSQIEVPCAVGEARDFLKKEYEL